MTHARRSPVLLALLLIAVAACGPAPTESPSPISGAPAPTASPTPASSDIPFAPVAWPASGTACAKGGDPSVGTRLARVEAVDAGTVVFTLCGPDGAFLARLAHPSMGIVDAADLNRVAADGSAARDLAGHGAYRMEQWGTDNVELSRIGAASANAVVPTVILRWTADAAARTQDLIQASVDGIDAPSSSGMDAAATTPSLTAIARPLLATAVLGFGRGAAFADARARRAIGSGIDRGALASAFPTGSAAADHLVPCEVPAGCVGDPFSGFNAPAAVATLQALRFNFDTPYTLTIPDAAIPGLPDPAGVAGALSDQLAANLGVTLKVVTMPAQQLRAAVDGGTVTGLYLDGVATTLADPSAFYAPLFIDHPASLAAAEAGAAVRDLQKAATVSDPAARASAYAAAQKKLLAGVPVVPLVHPGGETVFRTDVKAASASPLGTDPLGAMTAGDRGQVVFEQATGPSGGWCGPQPSADAYRLCALVTDGLYGYQPGSLDPVPALASACTPDKTATVWTCRLRQEHTSNGLLLDAADVVATIRAMADPADPVHRAFGDAAFAAWDELFGPAEVPGVPSPTASGSTGSPATPSGTPSGAPVPAPSPGGSGPASAPAGSAGATQGAGGASPTAAAPSGS